jgi:hypothetical protein
MGADLPRPPTVAGWAALLGGVAAVTGAFLAWATLTTGGGTFFDVTAPERSVGVPGYRHYAGMVAIVAGGTAALGGLAALVAESGRSFRRGAAAAVVGGIAVVGAVVLGYLLRDAIATTGVAGGIETLRFEERFAELFGEELGADIPRPRIGVGPGLWLSAIGGAAAVVGGVLALLRSPAGSRRSGFEEEDGPP